MRETPSEPGRRGMKAFLVASVPADSPDNREEAAVNTPVMGMPFFFFPILLILGGLATAVVCRGFQNRLFQGFEGFIHQWMGG